MRQSDTGTRLLYVPALVALVLAAVLVTTVLLVTTSVLPSGVGGRVAIYGGRSVDELLRLVRTPVGGIATLVSVLGTLLGAGLRYRHRTGGRWPGLSTEAGTTPSDPNGRERPGPTEDDGAADTTLSLRRVLDVLLVVALVLVVVPFAVYAVPSLVGAADSYVVRSGSMAPAIGTGDVVVVERAPPGEIEPGDVITFAPDGQSPPTTHRVVSKTERDGVIYFETKGDANAQPDAEPVVENELVGRVTLVLPYVGYVIRFASTSMGFFALVAAPFGLLLATEVWSLFRTREDGESGPETERTDASVSGAATADGSGSVVAPAPPEDAFTLTATDVRLSLAALLLFTGYSTAVAVAHPASWSIAVAVGALGTTVYLAAMRYTAARAGGPTTGRDPLGPPPAREVAPAVGRTGGPGAASEEPGSNGRLSPSLVEPPAAAPRRDGGNGRHGPGGGAALADEPAATTTETGPATGPTDDGGEDR